MLTHLLTNSNDFVHVRIHLRFFVECNSLNDQVLVLGEERDKDQTTIKIPADVINNRDINQLIETDIEETDVSIEIGDDKGKIIKGKL